MGQRGMDQGPLVGPGARISGHSWGQRQADPGAEVGPDGISTRLVDKQRDCRRGYRADRGYNPGGLRVSRGTDGSRVHRVRVSVYCRFQSREQFHRCKSRSNKTSPEFSPSSHLLCSLILNVLPFSVGLVHRSIQSTENSERNSSLR